MRTDVHAADAVAGVSTQLKEVYNANNLDTDFSQTLHEMRQTVDNQFSIVTRMLLALAIVVAIVGGIGLMGSLSISVVERTREIGVMRAIGARTRTMLGMFIMEGIFQGLFSWAVVVPLSFAAGKPMSAALGLAIFSAELDYRFSSDAAIVWLALIVVISSLASILPARSAARISVRESLAYA